MKSEGRIINLNLKFLNDIVDELSKEKIHTGWINVKINNKHYIAIIKRYG